MNRILVALIFVIFAIPVFSQDNSVEFGLFGLINRNLNFNYERKLTDYASANMGFGYLLPGAPPHVNTVLDILTDADTEGYVEDALRNMKFSAVSFTPELRYYFEKSGCKGLYFGGYAKYANYCYTSQYTSDVNYSNSSGQSQTKKDVVFTLSGKFHTLGAGLSLGYKWIIEEKFVVDWCIAAPGLIYGFSKANVVAPEFPPEESITDFVKNELDVIPDFLGKINVSEVSKIEAQGVWKKIYPTCRFNLSIGYL